VGNGGAPGGGGRPQRPGALWSAAYNPWTGLVQAWSVPFRPPSSSVLGSVILNGLNGWFKQV
jgi:hypothetical protein